MEVRGAHNCHAEEEPSAQLMEEAVSTKDAGRARISPRAAAGSAQELLVGCFPRDILMDVLSQMCSLYQSLFEFMVTISTSLNIYINRYLAELQLQVSDFCFYPDIKNTLGEGREATGS